MCIFVFKKWYEASIVMPYLFVFVCAGSSLLRGLFSGCSKQGCSLLVASRLLLVVVSLVAERAL